MFALGIFAGILFSELLLIFLNSVLPGIPDLCFMISLWFQNPNPTPVTATQTIHNSPQLSPTLQTCLLQGQS